MNPKHLQLIADALGISKKQIENTVQLLEEGATIPFIARYRKEVTGTLDEVQIGDIKTQTQKLADLEKRRESVLKSIQEQGKMTDDLHKRIVNCYNPTELEDIYLPYKQKRKTRASVAREKGLEPLANELLMQKHKDINALAKPFLTDKVTSIEDALQGARDILAEMVSESEQIRAICRRTFEREAVIATKVVKSKTEEAAKFKDYFEFSEPLSKSPSHRLLAMRRGEDEGFLRLSVAPTDETYLVKKLVDDYVISANPSGEQVRLAVEDAYERLIAPSMETEFRNVSKDKADADAIQVFVENLRQLLLQAPLGQRRVLGIDPGFRTGCKVVCLDASGNLLENATVYPHLGANSDNEAIFKLERLIEKHNIEVVAIGDGTAGRETETLCNKLKTKGPLSISINF